MKNNQDIAYDILQNEGPATLTADQYDNLKEVVAPILALLSKYDKGLRDKGSDVEAGQDSFSYGGATYARKKHGKSVQYKKALEVAKTFISDEEVLETLDQHILEELTKDTYKNVRV